MADDFGGHEPNRPGPGDQHVFTHQRIGQRRVYGVAEGIEDGSEFGGDGFIAVDPGVGFGDHHVFGEGPVALDADGDGVDAHLPPTGAAIAAHPADHMPLAGDLIAQLDVGRQFPDLHDLAVELVARDQRGLDHGTCCFVIGQDMQVGAADTSGLHTDFNLMRAGDGFGAINKLQALVRTGFIQCLHGILTGYVRGAATKYRLCPQSDTGMTTSTVKKMCHYLK